MGNVDDAFDPRRFDMVRGQDAFDFGSLKSSVHACQLFRCPDLDCSRSESTSSRHYHCSRQAARHDMRILTMSIIVDITIVISTTSRSSFGSDVEKAMKSSFTFKVTVQ